MATAAVSYTFVARSSTSPSSFAEVNENFTNLVDFFNVLALQKDGSRAMLAPLTFPSNLITSGNHCTTKNYVDLVFAVTATTSPLPLGTIVLYPGTTLSGFVRCNGAAYAPSALPALYALIGTTYGGYPAPPWAVWTFNVPNLPTIAGMNRFIKTS